jgi:hypothetical protein
MPDSYNTWQHQHVLIKKYNKPVLSCPKPCCSDATGTSAKDQISATQGRAFVLVSSATRTRLFAQFARFNTTWLVTTYSRRKVPRERASVIHRPLGAALHQIRARHGRSLQKGYQGRTEPVRTSLRGTDHFRT